METNNRYYPHCSECVESRLKWKYPSVMCKLDIEKAYNHINQKLLLNTFKQMGFGDRWLGSTWFCINNVSFSILINGEPVGFFLSEQEIRQGYLIPPFLFILTMGGFDRIIRVAIQNRWFKDFQIKVEGQRGGLEIDINQQNMSIDQNLTSCVITPSAKIK